MNWFSTIKNDNFWRLEDVQKVRGLVNAYFEKARYTNLDSIFTDMGHLLDKVLVYVEEKTILLKVKDEKHLIERELPELVKSLENDTGITWNIQVSDV